MATPTWAILLMAIVSLISAVATFLIKLASTSLSRNITKLIKNWKLALGIFLYGFGTILSLLALRAGELSVLYPFVALQYVWTNFLSAKFLKEKITIYKWIGVGLIVLGVSLIGSAA